MSAFHSPPPARLRGFAFDRRGHLIVSEAFGGALDASAVSSYDVLEDGALEVISASVPTTESAACWIAVTHNNRFAYTTNTGSGTITGYLVARDGSLAIMNADGITGSTGAGSGPTDLLVSRGSRFLYSLNAGNGTISAFSLKSDGSLAAVQTLAGLPVNSTGLVAE